MAWRGEYENWKPYVPVAARIINAAKHAEKLAKKEKRNLAPIEIAGRKIAQSFWGIAWCNHLESHSDFSNRLPRGRTYVRNGSVLDLQINRGLVKAIVAGSEVYVVDIKIKTLMKPVWTKIKHDCSRSIGSLIDLLQGRFDKEIMQRLSDQKTGLFPRPNELEIKCSCPDWALMCKHAAAVLYGIGARLDAAPELLFALRDVDHLDLISQATKVTNLQHTLVSSDHNSLGDANLGELFGIELEPTATTIIAKSAEHSRKKVKIKSAPSKIKNRKKGNQRPKKK